MVDSPIPKMDFGFIGNLPGNYYQGQQVGRERLLREGLGKLAPDDFQGMARLLAQFGDPKDAVQAMQLQSALQHQAFSENLQTAQLKATTDLQKNLMGVRDQRSQLLLEEKAAPYHALQSGIPSYAAARNSIYDAPGAAVGQGLLGGGPLDQINAFAVTVGEALHKKDPKAYAASVTPTKSELASGTAAAKFAQIEQDAATASAIGSSTFDLNIPEIPIYEKKPVAAPQAGHTPNVLRQAATPPPAGAVPPPVTVSPPGGEDANAAEGPVPRSVRTTTIRPKLAPNSAEESAALEQAKAKLKAHPNDPSVKAQVLQRLIELIEPTRLQELGIQ